MRLISAGGSALVGCAANPSDLPCCRGQQAAEGATSTRRWLDPWLSPVVLTGTNVAMGCRWAMPSRRRSLRLHVWICRPFCAIGSASLSYQRRCTAALSTRAQLWRTSEDDRLLRCWGCRATAQPEDVTTGAHSAPLGTSATAGGYHLFGLFSGLLVCVLPLWLRGMLEYIRQLQNG